MRLALAWLKRLFRGDSADPPAYDPRRDIAARWLSMKRVESERAERKMIKQIGDRSQIGRTGNIMEDDIFNPPRRRST